ncbi:MAG TPA: DUF1993 domain-containing protein [Caulobacteraceae bacterium]|jgi:hypothetical protein
MNRPMYDFSAPTFTLMLGNLAHCFDKAADYAKSKGLDPDAYVEARLAPDMFTLKQQVFVACIQVKDVMAVLTGKTEERPGENPDKTLADLKARIADTIAIVAAAEPEDFKDAEKRAISLPLFGTKALVTDGLTMLRDWTLPHFYFAVVTAYDILRHEGVPLGKPDYMTHIGPLIVDMGETADTAA